MDRLAVFKALGDTTRYGIYLELARADAPISVGEIAKKLGLHPNSVRPHLDMMVSAGLAQVGSESKGSVGRPRNFYELASSAPSLGLEPSAFRTLAGWLADIVSVADFAPQQTETIGAIRGAEAAKSYKTDSTFVALTEHQAELGFAPETETHDNAIKLSFTNCPYHEVAATHSEVICHMHRGMVNGFVAARGEMEVVEFCGLNDADPCHVDLIATDKR